MRTTMVLTSRVVAAPELGNTPLAPSEAAQSFDLKSEPATTAEPDAVDEEPSFVPTMGTETAWTKEPLARSRGDSNEYPHIGLFLGPHFLASLPFNLTGRCDTIGAEYSVPHRAERWDATTDGFRRRVSR